MCPANWSKKRDSCFLSPSRFFVAQQVVKIEMKGRTYYVDEVDEEKRPFRALLDVGIRSTSTG